MFALLHHPLTWSSVLLLCSILPSASASAMGLSLVSCKVMRRFLSGTIWISVGLHASEKLRLVKKHIPNNKPRLL